MVVLLERLQIAYSPKGHESTWDFGDFLKQQKAEYFYPFIANHLMLSFEYNVFCTQLANRLMKNEQQKDITKEVAAALMRAELLSYLYRFYLVMPSSEVVQLEEERQLYQNFLKRRGYTFPETPPRETLSPGFFSQKVRDTTAQLNWPRLFSGRIRRLLATLILIPEVRNFSYLCRFVAVADSFVNPVLMYVAWVFYVPRLATNLFMLAKHTIPGLLSEKEQDVPWLLRLQGQLQIRWFELGNDTVWLINGLLNCFVLTGALAPVGMSLTVSLFLFDAFWASLRAFIELDRLSKLEKQYVSMQESEDYKSDPEKLKDYLTCLRDRISFERERLLLSVQNSLCVFLGMCLALPIVTNPLVVFGGALAVLTITFITYTKNQQLEQRRPVYDMGELKKKAELLPSKESTLNFEASLSPS
jgi:hypothetical protein